MMSSAFCGNWDPVRMPQGVWAPYPKRAKNVICSSSSNPKQSIKSLPIFVCQGKSPCSGTGLILQHRGQRCKWRVEWESFWKNDQAVHSTQPYLITDALLQSQVPSISMVFKHRITWLSFALEFQPPEFPWLFCS